MKWTSKADKNTSLILVYIILVSFAISLYYCVTLPVSFDESCTFILFTNKGFYTAISQYPAPNNHVLFSILTTLTNQIPMLSNLLKLRLVSIGINILTLLSLYRFIIFFYNQKMALLIVCVFSLLFLNIYYSYMARGYGLINLFFINSLYYTFKICYNVPTRITFVWLGLFSLLGLYTIPTFIYPILTLYSLIVLIKPHLFWKQTILFLIVLIFCALLYSPIMYTCGIESITNNRFVKPMSFLQALKSLPFYFPSAVSQITGIHWSILAILLSWSYYKIVQSGHKFEIYFATVCFLAPAVLVSLQRVNPFARVFNYYSLLIVLIIFIPYKHYIESLKLRHLFYSIVVFQLILLYNFNSRILNYEDKDNALNITSDGIIKQMVGNKKYFLNGTLLRYNLEFNLLSQGYKNYTIVEPKKKYISADTLDHYDFVVTELEWDKTKMKQPLFVSKYYAVYSKTILRSKNKK